VCSQWELPAGSKRLDFPPLSIHFSDSPIHAMAFKKSFYRKTYSRPGSYRGYRGRFRSYGSKRTRTGPRANPTRTFKRPVFRRRTLYSRRAQSRPGMRRSSIPSRRSISAAAATALASSGNWSYNAFTERVDGSTGTQGWMSDVASAWVSDLSDFIPVIANAIARVVAPTVSAVAVVEPRFWIKKAVLSMTCTNASQFDLDVIAYPWIARYDNLAPDLLYKPIPPLETKAAASGTVNGPTAIGFNPFKNRYICEAVRILKPRRIHLQGGQSYTFRFADKRPLHLNYARLNINSVVGTSASFSGRTRGFFLCCRGMTINSSEDENQINWSAYALDIQIRKDYEWVCSPQPYHFYDVVNNDSNIVTPGIIQPQSGLINATPSSV